jgi:stage II sporulation protein GA (sporulation sigma-E factor processing peptidase)
MEAGVNLYVEVYVDVIFVINFLMDLLLLLIVKKVLKCPSTKLSLIIGACIGAVGACVMAIVPNLNGIFQFVFSYIIICFAMIMTSFRLKNWPSRIKAVCMLYITTFFLGGFLNALYYNTRLGYYFMELIQGRLFNNRNMTYLCLAAITGTAAIWVFIKTLKNLRSGDLELYETELSYGEKSIQIIGLLDTGNNLYDPIYGKPVIIAELSALNPLLTVHQMNQLQRMLDTLDGKAAQTNKHLISSENVLQNEEEPLNMMMVPYHSIGKRNGILPAIIMNRVIIGNGADKIVNERVLTAVSREMLSVQRKYQVILHRDIV